jgi:hypothetical protein
MTTIILKSVKCEKRHGNQIKLHLGGSELMPWTGFAPGETKTFDRRIALRSTPTNLSLHLFDDRVSPTLSASVKSISNVPVSSASKTFSYRMSRGKYKVTYRIEAP